MNRFLASLAFGSDISKSKSIGDMALLLCKDKHACALCIVRVSCKIRGDDQQETGGLLALLLTLCKDKH